MLRLFTQPDGVVDRKDRCLWLTGPFDIAFQGGIITPPTATRYTVTEPDPTGAGVGFASADFVLAVPNGTIAPDFTVSISAPAGVVVSPATLLLNGLDASGHFNVTAATEGNKTIQYSNNSGGAVADPDPTTFVVLSVSGGSAPPGHTAASLTCVDVDDQPEPGVRFQFQLQPSSTAAGISYPRSNKTVTSGGDGVVSVALLLGRTYWGRRETAVTNVWGPWLEFTTGTDPTFALPEIDGKDVS